MITEERSGSGPVKRIRDDIYHIDIPIDHPLTNLNLYLFLGDEPALVDTGPYHPLLEKAILEILEGMGLRNLDHIYLTHSHIDHFGLAARLRELMGASVVAHEEERPRVEQVADRLSEEYGNYASLAPALGFPEEFARALEGLAGTWISLSQPCPLDRLLKGGETVRAGDRLLEAVHTPGHTAGHTCYYLRDEGLLFSGDHLMRSITPNPELYYPPRGGLITGLPQFLDSLRLLKGMEISCAYPGHGKPIRSVRKRVEVNILHHDRRLEKTEEAVQSGCRTVWDVSLRLFPQIKGTPPDVDHFLALKEALGHLAILEEVGRVTRLIEGGRWHYLPPS